MTYGRTLVLFSSHNVMKKVYDQVSDDLERYDIVPLIQDRDGESDRQISVFTQVEHSVLFGVDRFWTGVDFKGPTLKQVIVDRIPVPHPHRPLIEHRSKVVYKGVSKNYWEYYAAPHIKLRMRQGFGRLIRAEGDEGLFICLDGRTDIRTHRSASWWQSLLHEIPVASIPWVSDALELAHQHLGFLKIKKEFDRRGIKKQRIKDVCQVQTRRY